MDAQRDQAQTMVMLSKRPAEAQGPQQNAEVVKEGKQMRRHRTKFVNGKWLVLVKVGPGKDNWAPVPGESYDDEEDAKTARDQLKQGVKK